MSRSLWAAAAGALALGLTPGVALAAPGSTTRRPAPTTTPPHHHRHRPNAREHGPGQASSTVLLTLGSGYQQPAGSARVKAVQRRLARLGFTPGPLDGRYGP